jgi:hypothetical protein
MRDRLWVLLLFVFSAVCIGEQAAASSFRLTGNSGGGRAAEPKAIPAGFLSDRLAHRGANVAPRGQLGTRLKGVSADDGLILSGRIEGQWDSVDGYVTFPYLFAVAPELGTLQVLVRGFEVQNPPGSDEYRVERWDRKAYWLRFDGNDPADVPRLVPAVELLEGFDPSTDTTYPELASDPEVIATCASEACSVQQIPYVELREDGVDYSAYPDGAAQASLLFVSDAAGDAIAAVLDIFDANGEFERTDFLYVGDSIKLYTNAYRMEEPDVRYLVEYVDFQLLDDGFQIERQHYIPNTDFLDSDLPPDLDAGNRPMRFLLDAQRDDGQGGTQFAYGGPFPLGMRWSQVPDFLFAGTFEQVSPVAARPADATKRLVRNRPGKD